MNGLLPNADERLVSVRDLLDLSVAFDILYHTILLKTNSRLSFGVKAKALYWFWSYLCSREQSLIVDGIVYSIPRLLEHGVRQGSVLVPVLFICMLSRCPLLSMPMVVIIINKLMTHNCHKALLPHSFSLPKLALRRAWIVCSSGLTVIAQA